ncbi:diguanylate cyclase OS=Rhodanobacter lindaniclasticus OX=75310 GN=B1991_01865 PE=4 SV=1 [Rhodanobacter lindaniclasticus]
MGVEPVQLVWQLVPAVPLLLVAIATRHCREPLTLRMLALLCVVLLETGININGFGSHAGTHQPLPCSSIPVATSLIWFGRWDFLLAMALCALGPLPALSASARCPPSLQYAVYMAVSVSLAAVLRAFMSRTLLEQFSLERLLRERAETDGLTGVLLRNRFLDLGRAALHEAQQLRQPTAILFLDADHFKRINDEHGHAAGDAALVALAARLRTQGRRHDLIGRIGGGDLPCCCPAWTRSRRWPAPNSCASARGRQPPPWWPVPARQASAWRYARPAAGDSIESLLARADHAMRQAKREGRDRVVTALGGR